MQCQRSANLRNKISVRRGGCELRKISHDRDKHFETQKGPAEEGNPGGPFCIFVLSASGACQLRRRKITTGRGLLCRSEPLSDEAAETVVFEHLLEVTLAGKVRRRKRKRANDIRPLLAIQRDSEIAARLAPAG